MLPLKKMKSALAICNKIIRIIIARELAEHIVKNSTKQGKESQNEKDHVSSMQVQHLY